MAEITLKGITKRYPDGFAAVKDVDLDIADGEFVILVGPSGCGKSTLLRMIVGLEDISDGEMRIGGEVVNGKAAKDRNLAMVFQNYALYPHLSVRENMAFPLRLAKVSDEEITSRVEEAAKVLELSDHLDRKPANLSGGQRQRVAMGRAIVRDPQAFLFDEPLSNLDAKLRVQMRTEIARIQKKYGTTTVYVTHDQTEAMTLGDRVAVLRKGVVQQVDSPRNLYNSPDNLFVAGFIGSPSMNLLPGRLAGTTLELPFGTVELPAGTFEATQGERNVIAGVRPEHFEDASLVSDADRGHGATFRSRVDVIEWMGSELYAYLPYSIGGEMGDKLNELAADLDMEQTSGDESRLVARFDAASRVSEGADAEVWVDTRRIHLFDPESGLTMNKRETAGSRDADPVGSTGGTAGSTTGTVGSPGGPAGDAGGPATTPAP